MELKNIIGVGNYDIYFRRNDFERINKLNLVIRKVNEYWNRIIFLERLRL